VKQGRTTYTLVTDGIERALEQAKAGGTAGAFRAAGDGRVELERICLAQSGQFTELRFRVRDYEPGKKTPSATVSICRCPRGRTGRLLRRPDEQA
jgi:hypothetical protein